jgi:peptide/nickel transport system substrate-binding protein
VARFRDLSLALTLCASVFACAASAAAENVVRWTRGDGVLTWDPHGAFTLPSYNGYWQVYEGLVSIDPQLHLVPGLALRWELLGPTTWRFHLRPGVTFHDGTPLTAEDVAFSIERALGDTSDLATFISRRVVEISAVDAHTVDITTKQPDPFLAILLRLVSIMSKAWAEQHGVTTATVFDQDQGTYARDHANGTGPFMLESHVPAKRSVFVHNPAWWGLDEHPNDIDRIVWTIIPDSEERVRALLDHEVDLLQDPPASALDRIGATPGLKVTQTWSPRVVFLGMRQSGAELLTSNIKGTNPFRDRRVRQAIYQAIDVEVLRDDVLDGLAVPTGMLVAPGVLPYDPEAARALLRASGYPDGFALRLDCPRARFSGEALCGMIANQLADVGVRVRVDALPEREWFQRIRGRATDFYLFNEFPSSYDSLDILREYHSNPSTEGATGYANPALDALIEQIEDTDLTYARDPLIEEAWRIILDDVVVVPLFRPMFAWAMREGLDIPMSAADIPEFHDARLH